MQKSVFQETISCVKVVLVQQTSNKFETSEQFHPTPAIKNERTEFITRHAPEGRLHVPAGPNRPRLFCSAKKGIKELCMVSVGRYTLRVPLSLFWSRSSSSNIYQNLEVAIFILRRLRICVIINLEDMLLMSQTLEELLMSRDTIIFLQTQLGFAINLKIFPSASPANRTPRLVDSVELLLLEL